MVEAELERIESELLDMRGHAKDLEHELSGLTATMDEYVRQYLDDLGGKPGRLAALFGVTRGRVYAYRDRGREAKRSPS